MNPTCKGCGKEIVFIDTKTGAKAPIDAKSCAVWVNENGVYKQITAHLSHFVTCPARDQFQRKP